MLRVLTALENVFSRYVPWHSEQEMRDALQAIQDLKNEINGTNSVAETPVETPAVTPDPTNPTSVATETVPAVSTVVAAADTTTNATSVSDSTTPDVNVTDATAAVNTAVSEAPHIPEPEPMPFPGSYTPPPAN